MASKIKAGQKVALKGVPAIIAGGFKTGVLNRIFEGEDVGTLFMPRDIPLCSRKHWIAFTKSPKGELIVDRGAEKAILKRGKSLLPSGIKGVRGRFNLGEAVVLVNEDAVELAVGMVNYHSSDIQKILGAKTTQIESILGFKHDDEVVHRDNLVITNGDDKVKDVCQLRS